MKFLLRPTQIKIPPRYKVQTKDQYLALDAVWKQLVKEDRERKHLRSSFPSLLILRNLMLDKDMLSGFTPMLRQNNLKNGAGFIDGFDRAFEDLRNALNTTKTNHLQVGCARLLLAVYPFPTTKDITTHFPQVHTFHSQWYSKNYCARVQEMIVMLQEDGQNIKGKSYEEIFDMFDDEYLFNIIKQEDYQQGKFTEREFQSKLETFAKDWLGLQNKKEEYMTGVKIVSDPDWMFTNSDGNDTRRARSLSDTIVITTSAKYNRKGPEANYHVPVKHLWEIDWLEEFER